MTFTEALREQLVDLNTSPSLARNFPRWFAWSAAADVVRAERKLIRK